VSSASSDASTAATSRDTRWLEQEMLCALGVLGWQIYAAQTAGALALLCCLFRRQRPARRRPVARGDASATATTFWSTSVTFLRLVSALSSVSSLTSARMLTSSFRRGVWRTEQPRWQRVNVGWHGPICLCGVVLLPPHSSVSPTSPRWSRHFRQISASRLWCGGGRGGKWRSRGPRRSGHPCVPVAPA